MMNLKESTENLYRVFAKYRFNPNMDYCPCCAHKVDVLKLNSAPLRELESEHLNSYAWSAVYTWGSVEDYKHYLPRILELAARGELDTDSFVLFNKFENTNWKDWPIEEYEACVDFLKCWMKLIFDEGRAYLDEAFEIAALLKENQLVCEFWKPDVNRSSLAAFVSYIIFDWDHLFNRKGLTRKWNTEDVAYFQSWILSHRSFLEDQFFIWSEQDEELSNDLSTAVFILEHGFA